MAKNPIGSTMSVDISELRKNLEIANRLIRSNESNWLASADAMEDWTKSENGLKKRMDVLSKTIDTQQKAVDEIIATKEEAIKQYGEESDEVAKINKYLTTHAKNLAKSKKEYSQLEKALENMTKENKDANEEIKDTTNESKKASKELDKLEDSAKDAGDGFTIAKGAIAGFIANGLTAIVSMAGNAVSSLMGLTESTLEYRREMARITTVADQVGVSGDRIIDKWMDMNAVIQDESSVTEGLNNLMTAGYTTEKELDGITKALEGASIQWAETLKFEGLSDSLQEWIGSDGASLTGQFAELLERLGYNLEDVTEQTKGMTDAQRRNWAIQTLNKEGLDDVSDAYREANADMIAYNKANADLLHAQSQLGEQMQPFVTIIKQGTADILYSFMDMVNGVDGAGDQLLYNVGYLAGQIYSNVKSFLSTFIPVIADAIPDIIQTIQDALPDFIAQGIAMVTSLIDGAGQMMPKLMSDTTGMLLDIIDIIAEYAPELLSSALDFFGQIVSAIPTTITQIGEKMPEIIDTVTDKLFEGEDSLFNSAISLLGNIVDAIPATVQSLSVELPKIISKISQSLTDAMPTILQGAKDLLHKIVEAIPDVINSLGESLPDIITNILQFLVDNAPAILEGAKDMLLEIVNAIPTVVASLGTTLWDILTAITQFFIDNAGEIWDIGVDIVQGIVDGIKAMLNAITEVGKWLYDHTIGAILGFFGIESPSTEMRDKVGKNIVLGMVEGIKSMLSSIVEGAQWIYDNTIGKIVEFFSDNSLFDIGKDIVNGIVDGVKSMGTAIIDGAKWIFDNTIGKVLEFFGIESPSTVMRDEVGKNLVAGMVEGIKSTISSITDAGKWLYDNTIGKIKGFFTESSFADIGKNAVSFISNGIKSTISTISSAGQWVYDNTLGKIKGLVDGSVDLKTIGQNVVSGITNGIESMRQAVENSANWIYDNTVGRVKKWLGIASPSKVMRDEVGIYIAQGLAVGIKDGEHYVADSVDELLNAGINDIVKEELDEVINTGETISNALSTGFEDGLKGTKRDLAKAVEETVTDATEDIDTSNAGTALATEIGEAVKKATTDYSKYVDASTDLFSVLKEGNTEEEPTAIADSLFDMAGQFGGVWGALADSIWGFISDNLLNRSNEEVAETAETMVNNLLDTILSLLTNLPQIISAGITFLKTFAIGLIQGIPEILKQLPQIISEMVTTLIGEGIPALFEVGVELIQGLIEGMFSINIWDVVKSIGNGIVNGFKKLFGIKSPSKVMADEVGKNLALGIEEGLTDNLAGVNTALRKGVDTSLQFDGIQRKQVNVYQTNNYSQAHSRYELYKSKHDTASAVKLALQGV